MSAPFHDLRLDGTGIEIWPPVVDLSPELITMHAHRARRPRLAAIHAVFRRLAALFGWKF